MSEKKIKLCVYCDKEVKAGEQSELTRSLIHKDCENDIMADIQDQKGQW